MSDADEILEVDPDELKGAEVDEQPTQPAVPDAGSPVIDEVTADRFDDPGL